MILIAVVRVYVIRSVVAQGQACFVWALYKYVYVYIYVSRVFVGIELLVKAPVPGTALAGLYRTRICMLFYGLHE